MKFRTIGSRFSLTMVAAMLVLGLGSVGLAQAAQNCDQNAIVYCGFDTKQDLISKLSDGDQNPYGRSNDLKAIFDGHNISEANINNAVEGVVTRDGRVLVDSKEVANGAWSLGRQFIEGSKADGSLWMRPTSASFNSDNLPALVSLDASGRFRVAILKACGNPVLANPVTQTEAQASFDCTGLSANVTSGLAPLGVTFTASAQTTNTTAQSYLFDFGDGTTQEATSQTVTHNYTSSGSFTARLRVKTAAGTTDYKTICQKTIVVSPPVATQTIVPPAPTPVPIQTPRTGASGAAGVMGGGGIMTYGYAHYRRSRRGLLAALKGKISK